MEASIDATRPGIEKFRNHEIIACVTFGGPGGVNPRQSVRPNVPKPLRVRIQTISVYLS